MPFIVRHMLADLVVDLPQEVFAKFNAGVMDVYIVEFVLLICPGVLAGPLFVTRKGAIRELDNVAWPKVRAVTHMVVLCLMPGHLAVFIKYSAPANISVSLVAEHNAE